MLKEEHHAAGAGSGHAQPCTAMHFTALQCCDFTAMDCYALQCHSRHCWAVLIYLHNGALPIPMPMPMHFPCWAMTTRAGQEKADLWGLSMA